MPDIIDPEGAPQPPGPPLLNTSEQKDIAHFFDQRDMAFADQPFSFDYFAGHPVTEPYQAFFDGPDPFYQQHTQDWLADTREGSHSNVPDTDTMQFAGGYQDSFNTFSEDQAGQAATLLQGMRTSHEKPFNQESNHNHNIVHTRHASGPQFQQTQPRRAPTQAQRHSLPAQLIYSENFLDSSTYPHDNDERIGANLLGVISNSAYAALPVESLPMHDRHHFLADGSAANGQVYDSQTQAGVLKGPLFDTEATIYATFGNGSRSNATGVVRKDTVGADLARQPERMNMMQPEHQASPNESSDAVQPHDKSTSSPAPAPATRRKPANNKRSRRQASSPGESSAKRSKLSEHQKRANHTNSEQRRRDGMKTNLKELEEMVPALKSSGGIGPVSKATALRMTVIFLDTLVNGNIAAERVINEQLARAGRSSGN